MACTRALILNPDPPFDEPPFWGAELLRELANLPGFCQDGQPLKQTETRPTRYPILVIYEVAQRYGKRIDRDDAERLLARSGFLTWGLPFTDQTLDRLDSTVSDILTNIGDQDLGRVP